MSRNDANLSCFRCGGEFHTVGAKGNGILYECQDCGTELTEKWTKEVASMDGAMGRLAEVLLEKAGEGE